MSSFRRVPPTDVPQTGEPKPWPMSDASKAGPSLPWGKGAASTTTALATTSPQATPASTSPAQDGQIWDGHSLALGSLFSIPIRVHGTHAGTVMVI